MEYSKETLSDYFDVPVRILPARPIPENAYLERRGQYDASLILEEISRRLPADGLRIMGLTEVDLGTLVLTYVFGVAEVNTAGLVSLTRLRPEFYKLPANQDLLLERLTKELLHELGHTFGLVHCSQSHCVMFRSATINQIDIKGKDFCPRCRELIHC